MNPLAQQAIQAQSTIQQAQARRAAAEAQAAAAFRADTAAAYQALAQLETAYAEKTFELAERRGEAPRSRYGMALLADSTSVTDEGVQLQWYTDTGPDDWFLATWDDLLSMDMEEAANGC